jgi:hypothetical protein
MEGSKQPTIFYKRRVGKMFGFENFSFDTLNCLYLAALVQFWTRGY